MCQVPTINAPCCPRTTKCCPTVPIGMLLGEMRISAQLTSGLAFAVLVLYSFIEPKCVHCLVSPSPSALVWFCSNWICQSCEMDIIWVFRGIVIIYLWISLSCYIDLSKWCMDLSKLSHGLVKIRPSQLAEPSRSNLDIELFSHSAYDSFFL